MYSVFFINSPAAVFTSLSVRLAYLTSTVVAKLAAWRGSVLHSGWRVRGGYDNFVTVIGNLTCCKLLQCHRCLLPSYSILIYSQ